jgi:hypothetical protein
METPKLTYFSDIYFATFNCHDYDKRMGREAVIKKFGKDGWKRVKDHMKTGIMEIFKHNPTPETELYAITVAVYADKRCTRLKKSGKIT